MKNRLKRSIEETIKGWSGDKWELYELTKMILKNAEITGDSKPEHYDRNIKFICNQLGI